MTDREKVIKGLEICVDRVPGKYDCYECPYEIDGNYCEINLAKDALTLLKEQEAVIYCIDCCYYHKPEYGFIFGDCTRRSAWYQVNEKDHCSLAKRKEGR